MLGLLKLCFELALPFAVIPTFIRPGFGIFTWVILALLFRVALSFRLLGFYRKTLEIDPGASADGTAESLGISRDLALQTSKSRLSLWVSKRTDIDTFFLSERRSRRILVLGRSFLNTLDEPQLRGLIEKAEALSLNPLAPQLTLITRLTWTLGALRIRVFSRNPVGFLITSVLQIVLTRAIRLQVRTAHKMGISHFVSPSEFDALLDPTSAYSLLAQEVR